MGPSFKRQQLCCLTMLNGHTWRGKGLNVVDESLKAGGAE